MKRLLPVTLLFAVTLGFSCFRNAARSTPPSTVASSSESVIATAYKNRSSNIQVEGEGRVVKLLADDNEGSAHQRFIIRLGSGQTLLVSHNIDIAPRVSGLREGDHVSFNGEYEWNSKGGVIHWTHHDPAGRHVPGWIKHSGRTIQ